MQKNKKTLPHLFILCGGEDSLGKYHLPMAPLAKTYYLEELILSARESNVSGITLCIGHGASQIIHRFKNGEEFGIEIDYSQDGGKLKSGGALKKAVNEKNHIENFLVLDCNRFINTNLAEFYSLVDLSNPASVALTFCEEEDGPSFSFEKDSSLLKNTESFVGFSPAGLYMAHRSILSRMPDGPFSLRSFLKVLANRSLLYGTIASGSFYKLSSPGIYQNFYSKHQNGLYQKKKGALFLDRDGVIIEDKHYLKDPNEVSLLPNIADIITWANDNEMKTICLTNQAGIAKGYFKEEDHLLVMERVRELLQERRVKLDGEFFCPFHPEGINEYKQESLLRKPNPGMAILASQHFNIDFNSSLMIGDRATDQLQYLPLKTFLIKGKYEIEEALHDKVVLNHKELLVKLREYSRTRI